MDTTNHYIEIDGDEIDVTVTWHAIDCESSSEAGNSWVTEHWKEADPICYESENMSYHVEDKPTTPFALACLEAFESGKICYE